MVMRLIIFLLRMIIRLNIDETIEFTEEENNLVSIVKEIITNYNNKVEEFDKFKNNFE